MSSIYKKFGLDPRDPRVIAEGVVPCTPEQAIEIRAEFGLLLPEELTPRKNYARLRRPTLADYNAMLAEDGKRPMTAAAYNKIMGRAKEAE